MRRPLSPGASNLVHLRGSEYRTHRSRDNDVRDRYHTMKANRLVTKSESETRNPHPTSTNISLLEKDPSAISSPDDLLDRLTQNLLQASLKRLSESSFAKRKQSPFLIQRRSPNMSEEGQQIQIEENRNETCLVNLGNYYSYGRYDGEGSEPSSSSDPASAVNRRGARIVNFCGRDNERKLESIEEVNEIESLRTATDKRDCNLAEINEFREDNDLEAEACVSNEASDKQGKRLKLPNNAYFRSSEVNPTQEVITLSRSKILREKFRKQQQRREEYSPPIGTPMPEPEPEPAFVEPWASKSLDKNIHKRSEAPKLRNLGHMTLNENVTHTLGENQQARKTTQQSRLAGHRLPFPGIEFLKKPAKATHTEIDRKMTVYRKKNLTLHLRRSDFAIKRAEVSMQAPAKESHNIGLKKLSMPDSKTIKRLVSFTTSDSNSAKQPVKQPKKMFLPIFDRGAVHRSTAFRTTSDQTNTRNKPSRLKEDSLLAKLNLKHAIPNDFDRIMISTEVSDDGTNPRKAMDPKPASSTNLVFKRLADQPYKLAPAGSRCFSDNITRIFQKHKIVKDGPNVYQHLDRDPRYPPEREGSKSRRESGVTSSSERIKRV